MTEVEAQLNSYRQSPRKVRLVADAIRGKKISEARKRLNVLVKRATAPLAKLLDSAVANAKNLGLEDKSLYVKSISVNEGKILYRRRPVAHGAAHPIRKRTSHIKIILSDAPTKNSNLKSKN